MLYWMYELNHAMLSPARAAAHMGRFVFSNPVNPLARTVVGKSLAAACEMFERTTRRYGKPEWGLTETVCDGVSVPVHEQILWERPFCRLIHFERAFPGKGRQDPKLLIVAPMSGHYATLLRGTVETMLPNHDVYITDWIDARMVPLTEGAFDLDDFIDYIISMLHALGGNTHVMAVCQPSVAVLAAVALMETAKDPFQPPSMMLLGGPIDTRNNPTAVNKVAEERDLDWFRNNVIVKVPFPHAGFMRNVYPGFLQITGFMTMNLDRHIDAHRELFKHLVEGDGDSAEKHTDFYDEYLSVMDLTAEFYLQTIQAVFIDHSLPKGEMMHRGVRVDPSKIKRTALMTVEGERDDITGLGQTSVAHDICESIPEENRMHYVQMGVGHYGVFNGRRFVSEIAPRISNFVLYHDLDERPEKLTMHPVTCGMSRNHNGDGSTPNRNGGGDDLTRISGIGPVIEKKLHDLDITEFRQIAELTHQDVTRIDAQLNFKGRIERDGWIGQARGLIDGRAK